jgi:hypothetical protein
VSPLSRFQNTESNDAVARDMFFRSWKLSMSLQYWVKRLRSSRLMGLIAIAPG